MPTPTLQAASAQPRSTPSHHCPPHCRPLQAAVAAANADPDGGVVYLPAGSYVLRQELEITRSNVVLLGDGVSWQPSWQQAGGHSTCTGCPETLPSTSLLPSHAVAPCLTGQLAPILCLHTGGRQHHLHPCVPR